MAIVGPLALPGWVGQPRFRPECAGAVRGRRPTYTGPSGTRRSAPGAPLHCIAGFPCHRVLQATFATSSEGRNMVGAWSRNASTWPLRLTRTSGQTRRHLRADRPEPRMSWRTDSLGGEPEAVPGCISDADDLANYRLSRRTRDEPAMQMPSCGRRSVRSSPRQPSIRRPEVSAGTIHEPVEGRAQSHARTIDRTHGATLR